MNRFYATLFVALIAPVALLAQAQKLDDGLATRMATAIENQSIPIMVILENAVDIPALKAEFQAKKTPVSERPRLVMRALKERAELTQPSLLNAILENGFDVPQIQTYWISNSISLMASPALIDFLQSRDDVVLIGLHEAEFSLIEPKNSKGENQKSIDGTEPGLRAIGAPELWALGYSGLGRLGLTFDTGIWHDHPALADRFLPNMMPLSSTWYAYDSPTPVDKSSSHGTHVSGIMLGLDPANNDTIGVAPAAYLIATDPIVSNLADIKPLGELMLGYQWSLNPDGDESTSSDVPDVINNSWGRDNDVVDMGWTTCPDLVIPVLDAVLAAGIANVFSAGNEGPNPMTIGVPHNINTGLVNSFTVAAVNGNVAANWPVATFSSRGRAFAVAKEVY